MEHKNRSFKGVWISKEIWLSKDLTLQEKVMLVELDSLDNENGCFASNSYFADFFNLSKGRISQIIKSLKAKNRISVKLIYKGKQIDKRVIKILNRGVKNPKGGIKEMRGGYLENDKDNNTINNTINNIDTIVKEIKKPLIQDKEDINEIQKQFELIEKEKKLLKKVPQKKVYLDDSKYIDFKTFENAFKESDKKKRFVGWNLEMCHDELIDWRKTSLSRAKSADWLATARNWMSGKEWKYKKKTSFKKQVKTDLSKQPVFEGVKVH